MSIFDSDEKRNDFLIGLLICFLLFSLLGKGCSCSIDINSKSTNKTNSVESTNK